MEVLFGLYHVKQSCIPLSVGPPSSAKVLTERDDGLIRIADGQEFLRDTIRSIFI